jgi:hypothetical protein
MKNEQELNKNEQDLKNSEGCLRGGSRSLEL